MSRKGPRTLVALLALALTVCGSFTAYYRSFGAFEPYDDEGALIEMIRSFQSGRPLYDAVPAVYGPGFFFYEWLAHRAMARPATTDSVRFVSAAFWVASALLVLLIVWRASGWWMLAAGAYLLAFPVLRFIGRDPAHPQELCLLLALALAWCGCFPEKRVRSMLLLGAIAGAAAMTKINMGAILALAAALALLYAAGEAPVWRALRIAAAACALALPFVLMAPFFGMAWAWRYFLVEELSIGAIVVAAARQKPDEQIAFRDIVLAAAGFAGAVFALALFAILHGSSVGAMIDWLIVKPRSAFGGAWYWAPNSGWEAPAWAVLGFAAALAAQNRRTKPWMIAAAKLALGAAVFALAAADRTEPILFALPPFLWLLTMPQAVHPRLARFSRVLLGFTGVLIVLYAFPVAGAQVPFVAVFLIAAAAVLLADGAYWMMPRIPARAEAPARWSAAAAMAAAGFFFCVISPLRAREHYWWQRPVEMPGARRLRLEQPDAEGLKRVVGAARSSCSMLLTVPGMPTFNAWTGLPAPEGAGAGNWVGPTGDAAQQRLVEQLSREPRVCVLYNAEQLAMWNHDADLSARPAVRYIRENFQPAAEGRGNVLMVRR